jgi:hypothetical protein
MDQTDRGLAREFYARAEAAASHEQCLANLVIASFYLGRTHQPSSPVQLVAAAPPAPPLNDDDRGHT